MDIVDDCNSPPVASPRSQDDEIFSLAVHGGAGDFVKGQLSKENEQTLKDGILEALKCGYRLLKNNANHLDAVHAAVASLEDFPFFNAGKGGKINQNYEIELDASIMDGFNKKCGAIAGCKTVKNPINAARLVMEKTPHIMLIGEAVDKFALDQRIETVPNEYFFTEGKIEEFHKAKKLAYETLGKTGTVGAVTVDKKRNIAAATSTGGTTFKMCGRVGDSPIIGAGNYANNTSVGVSCTGVGEEMIRNCVAFDVHARMTYKNISLQQATKEVVSGLPKNTGGFIAVDKNGNVEMPFNSVGMARGYVKQDGKAYIYIFGEKDDLTPCEYELN
jgi:beta-aspartyl-peptidase (threonine type)